jgi:hypothetical protein
MQTQPEQLQMKKPSFPQNRHIEGVVAIFWQ